MTDTELIRNTIRERKKQWELSSVANKIGMGEIYIRKLLSGHAPLTDKKREKFFSLLGIDSKNGQ